MRRFPSTARLPVLVARRSRWELHDSPDVPRRKPPHRLLHRDGNSRISAGHRVAFGIEGGSTGRIAGPVFELRIFLKPETFVPDLPAQLAVGSTALVCSLLVESKTRSWIKWRLRPEVICYQSTRPDESPYNRFQGVVGQRALQRLCLIPGSADPDIARSSSVVRITCIDWIGSTTAFDDLGRKP